MEAESFSLDICRGLCGGRCPNVLPWGEDFEKKLKGVILESRWPEFLGGRIKGAIKAHQKFKVSVAGCPNGCSRPQIADFGLIRAVKPEFVKELCIKCGLCVQACDEEAITLEESGVEVKSSRCLYCGACQKTCPTQAIFADKNGFRILLGGKLGRHPRLGTELPGIFSEEEVLNILGNALTLYMEHYSHVKRFGDLFDLLDGELVKRLIG